jgi:hypothetical protein
MKIRFTYLLLPIILAGCSPSDQSHSTLQKQHVGEATSSPIDGVELKKVSDIDRRLNVIKSSRIEDLAQAIAEVDEWRYVAEDEKPAREKIENEIEKLRVQIETEVTMLSKMALEAPKGKIATEKMSKVNTLLSLYPTPKNDEGKAKLEKIMSEILSTSRRIEDIRRLRYNQWAILWIQDSLRFYRDETKMKNIFDFKKLAPRDKEALKNACISSMSRIDPTFLEPAVMDLYNYVYGLTKDAMGGDDDYRIKLTQGFADPNIKRYTPSDF